ncbi:MAG: biopolymer transporter ExbD [Ruegeria sp.]|nr:biopolymer transporter ExbD [Ruegeria sp.]
MTSLIDVIFLLLLFFMLTSTFSKFGEVELSTATAGGTNSDPTIRFIKLESARILLDGAPVGLDRVGAALQADKPQVALISLTPQVTSQQLIELLVALRVVPKLQMQVMG